MFLILIRHGETESNLARMNQGWSDSYLTKNGEKQIKQAARKLKNIKIDQMIVSPLGRTMTTARSIRKYHDCDFKSSSLLMEYSMGVFEGTSMNSKDWEKLRENFYLQNYKFPNGESMNIFKKRITNFIQGLFLNPETKHKQCILAVTHGGLMHAFLVMKEKTEEGKKKAIDTKIYNTDIFCFELTKKKNKIAIKAIEFEEIPRK